MPTLMTASPALPGWACTGRHRAGSSSLSGRGVVSVVGVQREEREVEVCRGGRCGGEGGLEGRKVWKEVWRGGMCGGEGGVQGKEVYRRWRCTGEGGVEGREVWRGGRCGVYVEEGYVKLGKSQLCR